MKKAFLILMLCSFIFSCKKEEEQQVVKDLEMVLAIGNVEISDQIPEEKIGALEIVSGFYQGDVSDVGSRNGRYEENTFLSCHINTFKNSVQLHTVLNNGQPLYYTLSVDVKEDESVSINAESTAISLMFLHKLLITENPSTANVIIEKIKSSQSFPSLVREVETIQKRGAINNLSPNINTDDLPSYKRVLVETLVQLNQNYFIEQDGLEVIEVNETDKEITFKIKNYRKRYVAVYAEKYKNGQLTNTQISQTEGEVRWLDFQYVTSGSFSWIEGLLTFSDQITQESSTFKVNKEDAELIYLKCYGLGLAENSFPSITSQSFGRGTRAVSLTAVFDYAIPITSIVTGIKNLPKGSEFRGRPSDDPLSKIIEKWTLGLARDTGFHQDITNATINNSTEDILKSIMLFTTDFMGDRENVKLFYDLIKQNFNLSGNFSQETLQKSLSSVNSIFRAAKIVEGGVNVTESALATLYSKWETEFRIEVNGYVEPTPTTPIEGLHAYYPFNGNANDESGNGKVGVISRTELTNDRKGNANSAYLFSEESSIEVPRPFSRRNHVYDDGTVSIWFKPSEVKDGANYHYIFSSPGIGGNLAAPDVEIYLSNKNLTVNLENYPRTDFRHSIRQEDVGEWIGNYYNIVVTWYAVEENKRNISIYLNGTLQKNEIISLGYSSELLSASNFTLKLFKNVWLSDNFCGNTKSIYI
ncbi:hypothetical protein V9L05_09130 [Bernardetia sp. Wsw4-3y2]|uniref:hypothetical protein n=1 Tax=Bernardetia sp. Wsw4-3y2 TaxID=3127471 RepID=UPI0030D1ABD6